MLLLILLNVCNSQDAKNTYNYESQRSIVIDVNFDDFLSCFDLNDTGDIALQTHIPLPPRKRKHPQIPPPPPNYAPAQRPAAPRVGRVAEAPEARGAQTPEARGGARLLLNFRCVSDGVDSMDY